jgi:hypothetical protein
MPLSLEVFAAGMRVMPTSLSGLGYAAAATAKNDITTEAVRKTLLTIQT